MRRPKGRHMTGVAKHTSQHEERSQQVPGIPCTLIVPKSSGVENAQNCPVVGIKAALVELGISRNFFYRLARRRKIPRLPGHRFLTTRRRLLEWFEDMIGEVEHQ
jgi:hypothetical protein